MIFPLVQSFFPKVIIVGVDVLAVQVCLNYTFGKNEKIEHHIRKKTDKLIVSRFGLKVASFPYLIGLISHLCNLSLMTPPSGQKNQQWYKSRWFILVTKFERCDKNNSTTPSPPP